MSLSSRPSGRGPGGLVNSAGDLAHMPGMESISSTSMELPGMLR
jgi:hypothetical protein